MRLVAQTTLPASIEALAARAGAEDFRALDRLIADYQAGTNTFSGTGEVLIAALPTELPGADALIGICGLNVE